MKKFIAVSSAALAAASIAACGSTQGPTAPSHQATTTTSHHKDVSAVKTVASYYNMTLLQESLKEEVDKRSPTDKVKSIMCFKTGAQTAECNAKGSNGINDTASVTVHISKDGQSYITSGAGQ